MNKETLDKLQFENLKEILKSYCISGLGKELIDKLQPSSSIKVVKNRLIETSEARALLDASTHIPLEGIFNINSLVKAIEKGKVLEPSELIRISDFLRGCKKIKDYMSTKEAYAPVLSGYALALTEFSCIEEEINQCIRGNRVDSNATKDLKKIRRLIEDTEVKIEERLEKFLKNSANKSYIQEFFISKRGDRFTIPIKASYKNQVEGNVVETSSKGSTVFIEPNVISKLTSELITLKSEEAIEEYNILATLTGLIFENLREVKINLDLVSQYDMIFAKGKYSREIKGIEPIVNNHGHINLIKCKHPLLSGKVVPLDFNIGKEYRSLIITGPNAGGKTVVLKTIGLLTLAVQCGMHISGSKGTEIAIFDNIFVDIGDNQSIENALSTFSSHMKNLSEVMRSSNKNTLLLFDEIGSGTEPNEGAALAISILEEFYHMGCITVATTHYGEIKRFSESHSDFENAAMQFNSDTLEPLYKLLIGKSGDSNALWISRKMGIRESVLERAKKYIETKEYNFSLVKESKVKKEDLTVQEENLAYEYSIGDKVRLLDYNESAIVYKEKDRNNNIIAFYKNQFIEVNYKRIKLEFMAKELYPEGYDMNQIFISYKERKLDHDIERGSKKALKKIQKEIRTSK